MQTLIQELKCLYTGHHGAQREVFVQDRIDYFERMLADNPDNPTGLLDLANEYQKAGREEDEAAVPQHYLAVQADDEGNAYARLGNVLSNLGRKDEARTAYEAGITQSEKHGHSGMADDLRLALIQLNE
jgi:tetratricopeptide (TPR) repeat protein